LKERAIRVYLIITRLIAIITTLTITINRYSLSRVDRNNLTSSSSLFFREKKGRTADSAIDAALSSLRIFRKIPGGSFTRPRMRNVGNASENQDESDGREAGVSRFVN